MRPAATGLPPDMSVICSHSARMRAMAASITFAARSSMAPNR
jgi:hypothetical protein